MAKGYSINEIKDLLNDVIEEKFSSFVGNESDGVYTFKLTLTNYNGEMMELYFYSKEEV